MNPLRTALIAASESPWLRRRIEGSRAMRAVVDRYVAGDTLEEGIAAVSELATQGLDATLDHLGEAVTSTTRARAAAKAAQESLDAIEAEGLTAGISVKPTAMGLRLDPELAYALLSELAESSGRIGVHLTVDMEGSDTTEATVQLVERLRADGHHHVGIALQSMLRRTLSDIERLMGAPGGPASVRLCKGAYAESRTLAYADRAGIDAAFRAGTERLLATPGSYPRIATHDHRLIDFTLQRARALGVDRDAFELQMLYGVRSELQRRLAEAGARVCVYVPYGTAWYPYFMRRLAERPANLQFFLRSLVRG